MFLARIVQLSHQLGLHALAQMLRSMECSEAHMLSGNQVTVSISILNKTSPYLISCLFDFYSPSETVTFGACPVHKNHEIARTIQMLEYQLLCFLTREHQYACKCGRLK